MPFPRRSFEAYQIVLNITANHVLLVEGRDDKAFFEAYIGKSVGSRQRIWKRVRIDTAECLSSDPGSSMGAREKVEYLCSLVSGTPLERKLTGFVDREFRAFDGDLMISDQLGEHFVEGPLVWSLGHSIENYLLTVAVVPRGFRLCVSFESKREAVEVFEGAFSGALVVACALGFAARDTALCKVLSSGLDPKCFLVSEGNVELDLDRTRHALRTKYRLSSDLVDRFVEQYERWLSIVLNTDMAVVRMACHGHIGMATLWSVFQHCLHKSGFAEQAGRIHGNDVVRMNGCVEIWLEEIGALDNGPAVVISRILQAS